MEIEEPTNRSVPIAFTPGLWLSLIVPMPGGEGRDTPVAGVLEAELGRGTGVHSSVSRLFMDSVLVSRLKTVLCCTGCLQVQSVCSRPP